ncbi:hypothetical protein BN946_scf184398.g3 [Trametes cinnabarina]|uniref:Uncharacterized protein n=1 Tax=Pycnoporus cinnabarinus TaxID=5643 RepID=A0A060SRC8_PYCCI|nr:hypothetical protein BN946_scf184398.g3 [Trametes cinnabarina]
MPPPTRKPSQLALDLTSMSSHLSCPSMDSGYASSMSSMHVPADWMMSRMYENWKIADAAAQRLTADMKAYTECEKQLREAKKKRDQEKKSQGTKRRPTLMPLLFRKKSAPSLATSSGPSSSTSESLANTPLPTVEELEARMATLQSRVGARVHGSRSSTINHWLTELPVSCAQVDATRSAAERLDSCFDELRRVLDDGRPVSWRSSHGSSSSGSSYAETYRRARKTVATREEAYMSSKSTTKALQRACVAVQSAHHHYSKAMELLDVVCSPKKSKWEAMMGEEQSRQETYREAAKWAEKAQICFNECLRSLQPHWDLLKRDELEACDDLKDAGLLQALQLYNLMYGGKTLAMGITQQVQLMIQKQEAVFARLTNFAVWVQNCTEHCQTVELESRENRDTARRQLVALWVEADGDSETYSLVAPGERSHVFQSYNGHAS